MLGLGGASCARRLLTTHTPGGGGFEVAAQPSWVSGPARPGVSFVCLRAWPPQAGTQLQATVATELDSVAVQAGAYHAVSRRGGAPPPPWPALGRSPGPGACTRGPGKCAKPGPCDTARARPPGARSPLRFQGTGLGPSPSRGPWVWVSRFRSTRNTAANLNIGTKHRHAATECHRYEQNYPSSMRPPSQGPYVHE